MVCESKSDSVSTLTYPCQPYRRCIPLSVRAYSINYKRIIDVCLAIPTKNGNHTPEFTEAAASKEAHQACLNMSVTLAATGLRLLTDNVFFDKARICANTAKSIAHNSSYGSLSGPGKLC